MTKGGTRIHPGRPDGVHLAFASTRGGGRSQIYSMLADRSEAPQQLTTQGINFSPVWGK